jgi:hypothetical protein
LRQAVFASVMTDLKQHWLEALAVAAAAIASASRAGLIDAKESQAHNGVVATERAWLNSVDWS